MASSASGQYAANSVFWLATRAGKMERYCPPGTARFVPANFTKVQASAVQRRKWSPTANDPQTGNDPEPQMIPDVNRKWSRRKTANGIDFGFLDFQFVKNFVFFICFIVISFCLYSIAI